MIEMEDKCKMKINQISIQEKSNMFDSCIMCENQDTQTCRKSDLENYQSRLSIPENMLESQKQTITPRLVRSRYNSALSSLQNSTADLSQYDSKLKTIEYNCKYCSHSAKAPIILPCQQAIHQKCMIKMISVQLNRGDSKIQCICNQKLTHFIFQDDSVLKNQLFANQIKAIQVSNNLVKCENKQCDYVYVKDPNFKGQSKCPICF